MHRRNFLKTMATALPLLAAAAPGRAAARRKPNIVLLVADDLGYQELGCYGQKYIRTPNIDRIAREGVRFTQFYAGSGVCAPSRCTLMTGKHTGHAYIRSNGNPPGRKDKDDPLFFPGQHPIPAGETTIAELLKREGYATAGIGKWGLGYEGSSGDPNAQGFDLFYGYICQVHAHNHYPRYLWRNGKKIMLEGNDRTLHGKQHSQDLFIEEALGFIRKNEDRPFFLYMPFIIPHLSIQVPEETLNEYIGVIPEEEHEHHGYLKHPYPRAGYAAMITHMDKGIGAIMDLIKARGLDNDTIIIFTSDNGPTYDRLGGSDSDFFESAGPLRGLKGSLYEGGVRVPMVARWPGEIPAGNVSEHIAAFWDVMATCCEVADRETPGGTDGISFLPALRGKGRQRKHKYLYWEFPAYGGQQAVRQGGWKATRQNIKKGNLDIELYNLKDDIGEKDNVAEKHPRVVARMARFMEESRTESELFPLFPKQKTQR